MWCSYNREQRWCCSGTTDGERNLITHIRKKKLCDFNYLIFFCIKHLLKLIYQSLENGYRRRGHLVHLAVWAQTKTIVWSVALNSYETTWCYDTTTSRSIFFLLLREYQLWDDGYWGIMGIGGWWVLVDDGYWWMMGIGGWWVLGDDGYWGMMGIGGWWVLRDDGYVPEHFPQFHPSCFLIGPS